MTDQKNSTTTVSSGTSWKDFNKSTILEDIQAMKEKILADTGKYTIYDKNLVRINFAIQQLQVRRPDLTASIILTEGQKLAEKDHLLDLYWAIIHFSNLAAAGRPLPWEKQL